MKIKVADLEKVTEAISLAEGRAKERLVSAEDVVTATQIIEKHLGITKKAMEGTTAYIDLNAQHFANAYKYQADSTQFELLYTKGVWYLTNIFRGRCGQNADKRIRLKLTETGISALLEKKLNF